MTDLTRKVLPLPELLGREGFEVREAKGRAAYVDFTNKQFVVPFNSDPHASLIRAHENMHVQITPRGDVIVNVEGAENRTMQAIEDCRVNSALRTIGIDTSPENPDGTDAAALANLANLSPLEQARSLIAFHGRAEESLVRKVVTEPWIIEAADEIISRFDKFEKRGEVAPWSETIRAIEDLTKAMKDPKPPEEKPSEDSEESDENSGDPESESEGSGGSSKSDDSDDNSDEEDEEEDEEGSSSNSNSEDEDEDEDEEGNSSSSDSDSDEEDEDSDEDNSGSSVDSEDEEDEDEDEGETLLNSDDNFSPGDEGDKLAGMTDEEMQDCRDAGLRFRDPKWLPDGHPMPPGSMSMHHPPLTVPLPRPRTLSKRASDSGAIPVQVHRLTTDKRIFRERGLGREGVAILYDISGSMGINAGQIDLILKESPASVVATYTGNRHDGAKNGWLVIVAENKRRASDEILARFRQNPDTGEEGGNNVVDLPALQWLANRKERRKIWISDGKVTGIGNRQPEAKFLREIARVILTNRIEKFESPEDAIRTLNPMYRRRSS